MYKVKIAGAVAASTAAHWLNRQNYPYNLELETPGMTNPVYIFAFKNQEAASHFALKWV